LNFDFDIRSFVRNLFVKSIDLDREDEHIKRFIRTLGHRTEETVLRLNGQPVVKVSPPNEMSDAEKKALIEQRQALIRKARARTKGVPMKVIRRETEEAIREVRGRK
jgi:hypothetical protein